MYKYVFVFGLYLLQIQANNLPGEEWVSRARLVNPGGYFSNVIQELIYEVERREWSNLTLIDINQNINSLLANWHVTGTVLYTNGFVKSIQKIDISSTSSLISRTIVNDTVIPSASVSGRFHFRDMNLGYDVISNINDVGEQKYTGEILCNDVAFDVFIVKNVITQKITVSSILHRVQGPLIRMIYRPENHITQVLSRDFTSGSNWAGFQTWIPFFNSIVEDIVNNKIEFPRYCFNNCT